MTGLVIRSVGAITAGGPDAAQALGAVHAQIPLFGDTKVAGPTGEPITGAATPLAAKLRGMERVAALGIVALAECGAGARDLPPLPLVVCAPVPADMGATESQLLDRLLADGVAPIDRARSRVIARGKDGIGEALALVAQLLVQARGPGCYLLGADSLVTPERLKKLAKEGRVVDGVESDGFIPGEAGAALLFVPREDKQTLATVAGLGTGRETASAGGPAATGQGIVDALERALAEARVPPGRVAAIAHDLSGQYSLFEELALASARQPFAGMASPRTVQVSLTAGETGAAAGALSLAALAFFLKQGVVAGSAAALFTCDGPTRGAAVLIREEPRPVAGRRS